MTKFHYTTKTTGRGIGIKSQKELPLHGTLFATYRFHVFFKEKNRQYQFTFEGNDTRDNVAAHTNEMFIQSFKDARWRLFNAIGGSRPYSVKLINSYFIYFETESRVYQKEKNKKTHGANYYNNYIPDTTRELNTKELRKEKQFKHKKFIPYEKYIEKQRRDEYKNAKRKTPINHQNKRPEISKQKMQRKNTSNKKQTNRNTNKNRSIRK